MKSMDIQAKAAILRQHENYCYQISYYIVQDELLSVQAACEALLDVSSNSVFFRETTEEQKKKVKQAAIHSALAVKYKYRKLDS